MSRRILILGATSRIARGVAESYAARGERLLLAGRDVAELERIAVDLRLRHGAQVACAGFDADRPHEHAAFFSSALASLGGLDGVVLAFGYGGEQARAQSDVAELERIIARNFSGAASILGVCANHLEAQRSGFITVISSVAGDRGRQSNYSYGAAKAGLAVFAQGLRNRLFHAGVRVITVKPGFVDTGMTFGKPGLFLLADPDAVGRRIADAPDRGADVIYLPGVWRYILLVVRLLPERVFKRLKL